MPASSAGPSGTTSTTRTPRVSGGEAVGFGQRGRQGGPADAQVGVAVVALLDQHRHDALGGVDGHGKPHARVAPRPAYDLGVDADDVAVPVEQGASGVAGVDGRVGLDDLGVAEVAGARLQHPAQGADYAVGHAELLAEWAADGHSELADPELVAVAQARLLEAVRGRFDLEDTARSESGSLPSTVASSSSPLAKTTVISLAPSMTWWLVTMWPSLLQTKPLPSDGVSPPGWPKGPSAWRSPRTWIWATEGRTASYSPVRTSSKAATMA